MTEISKANKTIARTVSAAFGGPKTVNRYYDDAKKSHVDILRTVDRPVEGVTSYSTLSLSDHPLIRENVEFGTRVELVGAAESSFEEFANVLATAAFEIINDGAFCAPGIIFPGVFRMYVPESPLQHLLFVPPFLWGDHPETLHLPEKTVAWLLAVPITDRELQFAEEKGSSSLEDLFVEEQIDVFNSRRPSAL